MKKQSKGKPHRTEILVWSARARPQQSQYNKQTLSKYPAKQFVMLGPNTIGTQAFYNSVNRNIQTSRILNSTKFAYVEAFIFWRDLWPLFCLTQAHADTYASKTAAVHTYGLAIINNDERNVQNTMHPIFFFV